MGVPSPTIPSFVDGTVVHQADLNALASNLTNLYAYNQAGFVTQRPCVLATQTANQTIASSTDALVTFGAAAVNTDNMWVASQPTQLTIQHAGIYLLFAHLYWPGNVAVSGTNPYTSVDLLINGTNPASNTVAHDGGTTASSSTAASPGTGSEVVYLANLAAGATCFANAKHNYGASVTLPFSRGGSYLGAVYIAAAA